MQVVIDPDAGFCFGVKQAINIIETELDMSGRAICLGEVVHNEAEIDRLTNKGARFIDISELESLANETIIFRAHGEPPERYLQAKAHNNKIIDASCSIVLKLQAKLKERYNASDGKAQLIIVGKKAHPEVIGLNGCIDNNGIIIESEKDIELIDPNKKADVFCQTTIGGERYRQICELIKSKYGEQQEYNADLIIHDSFCRKVSQREKGLESFARQHDVLVFVAGTNSSNGKLLFEQCQKHNKDSYKIAAVEEIQINWFQDAKTVGVSGATSTPPWLLESVADHIKEMV